MKLLGSTNKVIRGLARCRLIEVGERRGLNALLWNWDEDDLQELWPLKAGLEVADDQVGLVELDLYLYDKHEGLRGNLTVWVFEFGKEQRVYLDRDQVPNEFMRAVMRAAK